MIRYLALLVWLPMIAQAEVLGVPDDPLTTILITPPRPAPPPVTPRPTPRRYPPRPLVQLDLETASIADCINAAKQAVLMGQIREATELTDLAQTRVLSRSVAYNDTNVRINDPLITTLSASRQALAVGDRAKGWQLLDEASRMQ